MNKSVKTLGIAGLFLLGACSKDRSPATGWNYNDPTNGGFQVSPYEEQETGPGLVFIEGGTFTMGRTQDDVMSDWNNVPRRITVSSFYMDETEVTNTSYREYLFWTNKVFGPNYPQIYVKALPDTLVWRSKLAFMEDMVKYYFRHPSYQEYPVVGINWEQANDFCKWRTDRVNEYILVREGIIDWNPSPSDADYFNTEGYLAGKWQGKVKVPLPDLTPNGTKGNNTGRNVQIEDGIFLPDYRLPTEAEWEFAASGLIGNTQNELISQRRIYPWNGHSTRNPEDKYIGAELANFKRGGGDYMGVAGDLNDAADITSPVFSYWPNDYGLYGMAGNVSEWVMDVYRPMMPYDGNELRAFRGNQFSTAVKDQDGIVIQDSVQYDADSNIVSIPGQVKYRAVDNQHKEDNLAFRRNYHESDETDYLDGDPNSSMYFADGEQARQNHGKKLMYETGSTTLIGDEARVYKGGSWKDVPYWMSPGSRRYLDEHQATDYIGFRCAMSRLGSPIGVASPGGRY